MTGGQHTGGQQTGGQVTALAQHACRRLCRWRPVDEQRDGLPLFRCSGCRSEWVRTQGWAPVDADGGRHPALAAELAARRAAAG